MIHSNSSCLVIMYLHNKALVCLNLALCSPDYDLALEVIVYILKVVWIIVLMILTFNCELIGTETIERVVSQDSTLSACLKW